MLRPLDEQVVVVMGASSGIGRSTALQAAERGACVVVSARNPQALQTLVDEISSAGGRALMEVADVCSLVDMQRVAQRAEDEFGGIDSWVHVAGVIVYSRFEDTTPQEFERIFDVNLHGQANGARAALPHLRARGTGALVHVSSVEARRSMPYHSAYAASKHAVEGFLESLRVELKQEKVPVSVANVMPGGVNTPLLETARSKIGMHGTIPPPLQASSAVARVVLQACEQPSRDLISGDAGYLAVQLQRISPRILDFGLTKLGFRLMRSNRTITVDDNVDTPNNGRGAIDGPFASRTFDTGLHDCLQRHSLLRKIATRLSGPPKWTDTFEPNFRKRR